MKGKVLDDDEPIPLKSRPTRPTAQLKSNTQSATTKNQFKFPSIQNEQIFESKLQEAPSNVNAKNYKLSNDHGESVYSYSTIKFSGDEDDNDGSYLRKSKPKPPKRSTSINSPQLFNLEQTFGGTQIKFDRDLGDGDTQFFGNGGFKPSGKFTTNSKGQKSPGKLFKSNEDDFKEAEFFDFSIRPRPDGAGGQAISVNSPSGNFGKLKSDLGVKGLLIKSHNNKFEPTIHTGFKPSFKLKDFPKIHGSDIGSGIASAGQIKTFYQNEESERDERIRHKLLNDPHSSSKAQLQQFYKAKEDERLEKLVEEQFRLQEQKQLAQEKEVELKHQQQVLQRQKEKLKQVEKHLSNKVTRQTAARQKRRPNQSNARRQRNPIFGGHTPVPSRAVTNKDGTYRVQFNVQ